LPWVKRGSDYLAYEALVQALQPRLPNGSLDLHHAGYMATPDLIRLAYLFGVKVMEADTFY